MERDEMVNEMPKHLGGAEALWHKLVDPLSMDERHLRAEVHYLYVKAPEEKLRKLAGEGDSLAMATLSGKIKDKDESLSLLRQAFGITPTPLIAEALAKMLWNGDAVGPQEELLEILQQGITWYLDHGESAIQAHQAAWCASLLGALDGPEGLYTETGELRTRTERFKAGSDAAKRYGVFPAKGFVLGILFILLAIGAAHYLMAGLGMEGLFPIGKPWDTVGKWVVYVAGFLLIAFGTAEAEPKGKGRWVRLGHVTLGISAVLTVLSAFLPNLLDSLDVIEDNTLGFDPGLIPLAARLLFGAGATVVFIVCALRYLTGRARYVSSGGRGHRQALEDGRWLLDWYARREGMEARIRGELAGNEELIKELNDLEMKEYARSLRQRKERIENRLKTL